jgi:hypothetical protein
MSSTQPISGLYSSTFNNANANIYIQYGTTGLGESSQFNNLVPYTDYRMPSLQPRATTRSIKTPWPACRLPNLRFITAETSM